MTRAVPSAIHRTLLVAALLCVLLARIAVPAGWMPMADGQGGIVLAPCSGMGAMRMAQAMPAAATPAMAGMHAGMDMAADHVPHDAAPDTAPRHPDPAGDHPCSGAGVSVALAIPVAVLPAALRLPPVPARPVPLVAAIGRGLAAPPPPATGPPVFA